MQLLGYKTANPQQAVRVDFCEAIQMTRVIEVCSSRLRKCALQRQPQGQRPAGLHNTADLTEQGDRVWRVFEYMGKKHTVELSVLEGRHKIDTDGEVMIMVLTGTCRPKDVSTDNTVLSTQLYGLSIVKELRGELRRASKKGILTRVFDVIFNL